MPIDGELQTSATQALPYSTYNDNTERLGEATGFEDKLTAYCIRRGTGNAIDGKSYPYLAHQPLLIGMLRICFLFRARPDYEA